MTLIDGLSYNTLDPFKFLGRSRTSALPLIAIEARHLQGIHVNISVLFQRVLLDRPNVKSYRGNAFSFEEHITISSLLITTKPLQQASLLSNWTYSRVHVGYLVLSLNVTPSPTVMQNQDGLTVSDIMSTVHRPTPTEPKRHGWQATLHFVGLALSCRPAEEPSSAARQVASARGHGEEKERQAEINGKGPGHTNYCLTFTYANSYSHNEEVDQPDMD